MSDHGRGPVDRPRSGDWSPTEEADPGRFRWIVDGHNAIFGVRAWEALQVTGHRSEARHRLEENLEAFGRAAGVQVWVVYDGITRERNPDAVDRTHLRSEYSWPPETADERICYLAEQAQGRGEHPVVVTSDRRTLARSLPAGTRVMEVSRFFGEVRRRLLRRPEKWLEGDRLEDIERHFLSVSPHAEDREIAERERESEVKGPEEESDSG